MRKWLFGAVAGGFLLMGGAASRADVIFQVTQIGPTMQTPFGGGPPFPNPIIGDASFVVRDDTFAAGMNFHQANGAFGQPFSELDGLIGVHVGLSNLREAISASLDDFTAEIPYGSSAFSRIELTSAPGGLPIGTILYSSALYMTVQFTFDGSHTVSGMAMGDGSCNSGCRFTGTLTVAVPEPASVLIFGIALIGLAAGLRRRSTCPGG